MSSPRIGCVLMASGFGARFGANKLLAPVEGRPLVDYALRALPEQSLCRVAVVTQYDAVAELARVYGFETVFNPSPELGISGSIRLGTLALAEDCDAILYQVADQPLLRRETVQRLIEAWIAHPEHIVVPVSADAAAREDGVSGGRRRGNPCVFPKAFFPQLTALEGDRGGSQIIRRHPDALYLVEVPERELLDVDSAASLQELTALSRIEKPLP